MNAVVLLWDYERQQKGLGQKKFEENWFDETITDLTYSCLTPDDEFSSSILSKNTSRASGTHWNMLKTSTFYRVCSQGTYSEVPQLN